MKSCKTCRYAIYDPLWTEWKCGLKQIDVPEPEEYSCKSYIKGKPRRHHPFKEPKLGKPGDKILVENGTFYASGDLMTGYRSVTVKVPASKESIINPKTITENGTYDAKKEGADGYNPIVVNIPDPILQDKTVNQNGIVTADKGYDGLSSVTVDIPDPVLQEKTIDISENGTYTIVADASHDGLVKVIINVNIKHTGDSTTAVVGRAVVGYAVVGRV